LEDRSTGTGHKGNKILPSIELLDGLSKDIAVNHFATLMPNDSDQSRQD
jgi:hypothetical protein